MRLIAKRDTRQARIMVGPRKNPDRNGAMFKVMMGQEMGKGVFRGTYS